MDNTNNSVEENNNQKNNNNTEKKEKKKYWMNFNVHGWYETWVEAASKKEAKELQDDILCKMDTNDCVIWLELKDTKTKKEYEAKQNGIELVEEPDEDEEKAKPVHVDPTAKYYEINPDGFLKEEPGHIHPCDLDIDDIMSPVYNAFDSKKHPDITRSSFNTGLYLGRVPDGNFFVLPNFICPFVEEALDEKGCKYSIYTREGFLDRYGLGVGSRFCSSWKPDKIIDPSYDLHRSVIVMPLEEQPWLKDGWGYTDEVEQSYIHMLALHEWNLYVRSIDGYDWYLPD